MYDTIMSLPLFKGIGEEQLSQLLEKTSVEFLKYEEGDTIATGDMPVTSVDFILSGRVRQTYSLVNFTLGIDEILGKGAVVGALRLFGIDTTYSSRVIAMSKVSMMRIGKRQYMDILQSDPIYMLNFVNYLSAAAQNAPGLFVNTEGSYIGRTLETMAYSIASRAAETIMVVGNDEEIAQYCGVTKEELEAWKLSELAHNRILSNARGIILKSPHLTR